MKKCPYCAEEIQDEAIKCRHCGEFLDGRPKNVGAFGEFQKEDIPWYFKSSTIILAVLTVGPFALPLIWFHPKYTLMKKLVITGIVLAVTYFLSVATAKALRSLMEYYKTILGPMG